MASQQPQVFISYQRTDAGFARRVREHLVAHGVKTWMDQYDIPVGAYWPDEIDKGLTSSDIVVGILSPDAVASRNVKNEWDWAIQNDKRLLLLQVTPCVIPHRYVSINFIDASAPDPAPALSALLATLGVSTTNPTETAVPETHYAHSGDISIAYQVLGEGPIDLVMVPGFVSNVEYIWEEPNSARFMRHLASFSRLIIFDKRGTGLSDRVAGVPTLEERMDDVRAVMDAVGSEHATIMGASEGGPMAMLFAATYPQRTDAIILYGTYARRHAAPDYPWGRTPEEYQWLLDTIEHQWGSVASIETWAPSAVHDERFRQWFTAYVRQSASPGAARAIMRMNMEIDVRHILPTIRVPTLVIHRTGDRVTRIENGRYLAERISGAQFVELSGDDHMPSVGDAQALLETIEAFVTGRRASSAPEPDRMLSTVLAVASSAPQQEQLRGLIRDQLDLFRGREVAVLPDGVSATFDGPVRAIRCAAAIVDAAPQMGVEARAGLHTGEIELREDSAAGIPVRIAAELAGLAEPGSILVSSTVKDLVAGSGIRFDERGSRVLADLPDEWRLFAVDQRSVG